MITSRASEVLHSHVVAMTPATETSQHSGVVPAGQMPRARRGEGAALAIDARSARAKILNCILVYVNLFDLIIKVRTAS